MLRQNAPPGSLPGNAAPPIFATAAATAGAAPESRTASWPAWYVVAVIGSGTPPHSFMRRIASSAEHWKTRVVSSFGRGRQRSETSVSRPSVPSAPVMSRATSKPATFFITRPPNERSSPLPSTMRTPRMMSRTAPAYGRRGPERPAATNPPIVAASPKRGGSQASICPDSRSVRSTCASEVPARAVTTSSVGS